MNIFATARDLAAKQAVWRELAALHDHWSEEEQIATAEGRHSEAEEAHQIAVLLVRAYRAELDDPTPSGLPKRAD